MSSSSVNDIESIAENVSRFHELFKGYTASYGVYRLSGAVSDTGKREGDARTVHQELVSGDYREHLQGKHGIGVIPIMEDSRVHFAAIDIDVYPVDLWALAKRIRSLPLVITRSKSGGGHIWLFSREGVTAKVAQDYLARVAGQIGHGGCEIFPKQTKRVAGDTGNWINLPYFGDTRTCVIYITDADGNIGYADESLETFLAFSENNAKHVTEEQLRADYKQLDKSVARSGLDWEDGPPCLHKHVVEGEITTGERNEVFFDATVYLKRKYDDEREIIDILDRVNNSIPSSTGRLSIREIQATVKSAMKKDYHYRCDAKHLKRWCDRTECTKREYGVSTSRGDVDIEVRNVMIIKSDPVVYVFNIGGHMMHLGPADVTSQRSFGTGYAQATAMAESARTWSFIKNERFAKLMDGWLSNAEYIEPAIGSDTKDSVREALILFLEEYEDRKDNDVAFFRGRVIVRDNDRLFQVRHFKKFLQRDGYKLPASEVSRHLRALGCDEKVFRIDGRSKRAWYVDPEDLAR